MDHLTLEPFSVVQHWTLPAGTAPPQVILAAYLETLARDLQAAGECVIGHIKALALFPHQGYLRLSVIAAHLPATIDGAAPPGLAGLDLTLNVLVYGLEREQIAQIVQQVTHQMAEKWQLEITSQEPPAGLEPAGGSSHAKRLIQNKENTKGDNHE
jgi:hypothetical protein